MKFHGLGLTSVQESPFRQVDYEKDVIVEAPFSFDWDSLLNLNIQLEDCVQKYLGAFEGNKNYVGNGIANCFGRGDLNEGRHDLAAQLLREVQRLRGASAEERDWDMNVEDD